MNIDEVSTKYKFKKLVEMVDCCCNSFNKQYVVNCLKILEEGDCCPCRTIYDVYKVPNVTFNFDLSKEFPILNIKHIPFKSILIEMLWIYILGRNDLEYLHERNIKFWDKWNVGDGTIGNTYGYIIKKYDQFRKAIDTLRNDPYNRRIIIDLFDKSEVEKGTSLPPCINKIQFTVCEGKLNMTVYQRSGDMAVGIPFDITEMALLNVVVSKLVGLKPGNYMHVISDAHIYINNVLAVQKTIYNYLILNNLIIDETYVKENKIELGNIMIGIPEICVKGLNISSNIEDVTEDKITLHNYYSFPRIPVEVNE